MSEREQTETLADFLNRSIEESRAMTEHLPKPIASVSVSLEGRSIDVSLDTSKPYYSEWIKGEGADIGILRDDTTNRVVGVHLPLYARTLMVSCGDADVTFNIPANVSAPQPEPPASEPDQRSPFASAAQLSPHDRLQIEQAARGCISGTLSEWPDLSNALRLCGYYRDPEASAIDIANLCRMIVASWCAVPAPASEQPAADYNGEVPEYATRDYEVFNGGISFALRQLAGYLNVQKYSTSGGGTETLEGDTVQEISDILESVGVGEAPANTTSEPPATVDAPRVQGWYELNMNDGRKLARWWSGKSWHYHPSDVSVTRGIEYPGMVSCVQLVHSSELAALREDIIAAEDEVTRLRGEVANARAAIVETWNASDEERLKEMQDANDEAAKWKSEGDMYGWNFHIGKAGGMTHASIIFHRVKRKVEEVFTTGDAPGKDRT